MTNNKKMTVLRRILTVLCVLALLSTALVIAFADQPVWSSVEIEEEYEYGSTFSVPERKVTVNGKTQTATSTVILPDGSSTVKTELTLNVSGRYTVVYRASADGKPYAEEHSFIVRDFLYSFSSERSSAQYVAGKGLMVSLAEGDTMNFNVPIDLTSCTANDVLIGGYAAPEKNGTLEFRRLYFTFTDMEDADQYLRFSARQYHGGDDQPYTYYMVGGNGQKLTGGEMWKGELKKHVEGVSNFGTPARHSFRDSSIGVMSLRYDAVNKAGYISNVKIADLDDPLYFSDMWSGLSSGKVQLSITGDLYDSAVGNFCLTDILGVDLTSGLVEDHDGPVITVDTPYETMPEAAKGCSYAIPTATAKDANTGVCSVDTSVWFNYTSDDCAMVDIVDGKFTANRLGYYAIVYESSDKWGNTAQKVLWVHSSDQVKKPQVKLEEGYAAEVTLGEMLTPAGYEVISYSGDGAVDVSVSLNGTAIALVNGSCRPETAGTYVVTYTAKDYIGQTGVITYEVEAKAGDKPVFVDRPEFPRVLLAGSAYTLPELYANDYRNGKLERKLATAEITDHSGVKAVKPGESFTPEVKENGDTITVTYICDGVKLDVELPVIVVWQKEEGSSRPKLVLENYFYAPAGTLTFAKREDAITIGAGKADAAWLYANALVAENFQMALKGNGKSFDALAITLTDAENPGISVTVKLINNGSENAAVKIGDAVTSVSSSFAPDSELNLKYSAGILWLGESSFAIDRDDQGNAFQGFPSNKLYLQAAFEGAGTGGAYDLLSINGYAMSNLTSDRTGPMISILGKYGGTFSQGSEVTIPPAVAADVLDANVTFSITVTDPDGEPVTSDSGVVLDNADPTVAYTLKLDRLGQYTVRLVAEDVFNARANETVIPYILNVADELAPEITYQGKWAETAKVGDVLTIPGYTVADNISAPEKIQIQKFVYTPSGRLVRLQGACVSLKAAQAGDYEFRIYVLDEAGNLKLYTSVITVTEE